MANIQADFTPGPWFVGSDDAPDCDCHKNSGLALVDTGREGMWPIARLCEWNNVALIHAAPDLLDALNGLVGLFHLIAPRVPQEVMADVQDNHRWHDAHAAIYKATHPPLPGGNSKNG